MTRVIVAGSVSPFTAREEQHWVNAIARELKNKKYDVDVFLTPTVQDPLLVPDQMMALRLLDTYSLCDILITVGYPAFVIKHPHKRALLFSLNSMLHEWYDSQYGVLSTPQYYRIRTAVMNSEKQGLAEAERIICASNMLTAELNNEYCLKAESMLLQESCELFSIEPSPDDKRWIFCESMLEPAERVDLLVDALAFSNGKWNLNLFIPSCSDVYMTALRTRINRIGIKNRITITERALKADDLKHAYAYLSVMYSSTRIPGGAIRAVNCNIPIISTSDCGALQEIAISGTNAVVAEPAAAYIARICDQLIIDEKTRALLSTGNRQIQNKLSDIHTVINNLVG